MAVAYLSHTNGALGVGSANYVLNKPASVVANTVMYAMIGTFGNVTLTQPSGWTLIGTTEAFNSTTGNYVKLHLAWLRAGGSEPSTYTWTSTTGTPTMAGFIVAYSGARQSGDPHEASAFGNNNGVAAGNSTIDIVAVTSGGTNRLAITGYIQGNTGNFSTASGWTERFGDGTRTGNQDKAVGSGSTGATTITTSGAAHAWCSFTAALVEQTGTFEMAGQTDGTSVTTANGTTATNTSNDTHVFYPVFDDDGQGGFNVELRYSGDADQNNSAVLKAWPTGASDYTVIAQLPNNRGAKKFGPALVPVPAGNYERIRFEVTDASGATGTFDILTPLALSDATVEQGDVLQGTVVYQNNTSQPFTISDLVIAARPPGGTKVGGPHMDLTPTTGSRTIQPGATLTHTATRIILPTDPIGSWFAFTTYRTPDGVYYDSPDVNNVAFTVQAAPAGGRSFYVDPVTGQDSDNGTTPALAKQTLGAAFALLTTPGDTLYIRGGATYNPTSSLTLPASGSASAPITVKAYPGDPTPIIDGQYLSTNTIFINRSYITLDGFRVTRGGRDNTEDSAAIKFDNCSNGIARNLTVDASGDIGLAMWTGTSQMRVEGGDYSGCVTGVEARGKFIYHIGVKSHDHNRMLRNGGDSGQNGQPFGEHGGQAFCTASSGTGSLQATDHEYVQCETWRNYAASLTYGQDGAEYEIFGSMNVVIRDCKAWDGVVFSEGAGPMTGVRIYRNEVFNMQFCWWHAAAGIYMYHNSYHCRSGTFTAPRGATFVNGGIKGSTGSLIDTTEDVWFACMGLGTGFTVNSVNYSGSSDWRVRNNIFSAPRTMYQLFSPLNANVVFSHNRYHPGSEFAFLNNGAHGGGSKANLAAWDSAIDPAITADFEVGSSQGDPLYVDPVNQNLHLQATSPCRGAGVSLGAPYELAIQGTGGPDIGRWEEA